jgi:two-component system nitrate/nitrite response regulator NarL
MNKVIVASDVCLFRQGLSVALTGDGRFDVVASACSGQEVLHLITSITPSIVLMDMGMAGAHLASRTIRKREIDIKVIALCVSESVQDIMRCAESGVNGYVSRDGSIDDLVSTVQSAERGELVCSGRVAAMLLSQVNALTQPSHHHAVVDQLTPRELEVAVLVSEGLSNKQIATRLKITISTTKNHVHHLLEKLGARHRAEAAAVFRRAAGQQQHNLMVSR